MSSPEEESDKFRWKDLQMIIIAVMLLILSYRFLLWYSSHVPLPVH